MSPRTICIVSVCVRACVDVCACLCIYVSVCLCQCESVHACVWVCLRLCACVMAGVEYIHAGRCGRAGRMGLAIALVSTHKERVWYHKCDKLICDVMCYVM